MNVYYLAVGITFLIDIILYSVFSVFNKVQPELLGLPFFYWYQILMLVVTTVLMIGASTIKNGEVKGSGNR
ncbi:MAG: hypothetical protein ASUL_02999 [Candidatus Aramenus sulfurataquae]|uniref:DUF3311 domain-containing protein n=1 Tax=Candidatus Aramenus sulfurataquae TaxID=1326980 RepID=W7KYW8_9CREN|nr:MAG: hypothetical protein ASUL_02999 [Candidatus Aramenus sulfurataquae]MCL7344678.1 DUF3311 domain-containing protein [Candidatus Aramenus sulfurataquae]